MEKKSGMIKEREEVTVTVILREPVGVRRTVENI
jgi:hypothetical protein